VLDGGPQHAAWGGIYSRQLELRRSIMAYEAVLARYNGTEWCAR